MNNWLERHRTLVLATVGLAITASVLAVVVRYQRPSVIEILPPPPTATPGPVTVHVSGAVTQPDVYQLSPDAIVRDAIQLAGGPTANADLNLINLAQHLSDGQQIFVPEVGQVPPPIAASGPDGQPIPAGPLNINTATSSQLETLPGIGPAIAQAIIDYRETNGSFTDITQIQNVPGIGPAKFEGIQALIVIN